MTQDVNHRLSDAARSPELSISGETSSLESEGKRVLPRTAAEALTPIESDEFKFSKQRKFCVMWRHLLEAEVVLQRRHGASLSTVVGSTVQLAWEILAERMTPVHVTFPLHGKSFARVSLFSAKVCKAHRTQAIYEVESPTAENKPLESLGICTDDSTFGNSVCEMASAEALKGKRLDMI